MLIPTMCSVTQEMLAESDQLRLIQQCGSGLEGVDIEAAREKNMGYQCTDGYIRECRFGGRVGNLFHDRPFKRSPPDGPEPCGKKDGRSLDHVGRKKMKIVDEAIKRGRTALSEYESKQLLAQYGIPVTQESLVGNRQGLLEMIEEFGYPIVLKGCSPDIAHKTEKCLIHVDIRNEDEALAAFKKIVAGMNGTENPVLVQEMVKGKRELVAGLTRDPQFGPCVMFGIGGIFTEILKDITFRVAPLEKYDALEMMQEIRGRKILDAIRGMETVDLDMLADILINIGKIGMENEKIKEIDINPLIILKGKPVAVDALVVLLD